MKIYDSGFHFHKISLSGTVQASSNITDAMVMSKRALF